MVKRPGWYEERKYLKSINRRVAPRHRKAAIKGWKYKKHGYPTLTAQDIGKKQISRTLRARRIDDRKHAVTFTMDDERGKYLWWKNPGKYDIKDIDSYISQQSKIIDDRRQAEKKYKRYLKEQKKTHVSAMKYYKKFIEEQDKRREHLKHTKQRKKEVEYVMDTTGMDNYVEADALVKRARRKGIAYDKVNWDRLQGKDLKFGTRVKILEEIIGETKTQKSEYDIKDISSEEERFYEQQETYMKEMGITGHE